MFSLIWRFLPGPAWLRVLVILAAIVGLVFALVYYIYPLVQEILPEPPSTVEE
ncbi:hypothetical protein KJY77_05935 [Canibacter sp. lx-72]|uniref:hypothetical protein n=1 Tax=Canibacter zhuwentaonis TaxID=2837491 RepID=UPI001BDC0D0F|nr:hypothetical protein [Canibacter zhuwentaonis]MBT1018668.1 hypothetical protein [Canibacter zhuwentaonis]MBT1035822.1 hypothetical protein [Canibacter zhuwentaonis]